MSKLLLIKLLTIIIGIFALSCTLIFFSPLKNIYDKKIETGGTVAVNSKSGTVSDNKASSSGQRNNPEDEVDKIVDSLTPEQMAGQMLMVGFDGLKPDYYISRMINLRYVGGVVLYGRNIKTKGQVTELDDQLQKMSLAKDNLPLFISVDQEGGLVDRFKGLISETPDPPNLGKLSADEVSNYALKTGEELKPMGINVNLAPVLAVAGSNSIMLGRAYGDDPNIVAKTAVAAITGYKNSGIIPCAKHFPGLGLSLQDTHTTSTVINSSLDALNKRDLIPFRAAIQDGVEMIMVNHAIYPALDPQNPASLSYTIQTDILRDKLGYKGLILTDDLEMAAAEAEGSVGQNAVKAVKAGADIVLVCQTPEKQKEAYDALLAAIKSGEISQQRLKDTMRRIVTLKLREQRIMG
ncbi:beta-hexosaminidase A precursor [Desulfosporosinus acididurans]|uniref:beta-N-acetylhexosaminidase n=1 Tax=Desulfosporosinus acididurans TaxID=476652 RepID=A0A0J1FLA6_9FIRM|nr:beta-N-acetylhexosaminidase [Desulfosporosinus acididurans]KLU63713.1 beta-hexosaminidase A precursor [Desulfosporosinus acididurans]